MTKKKFKLDWRNALSEVVFIFIGISLAMGFQNWNDSLKERQETIDILAEIQTDLQEDTLKLTSIIDQRTADLEATHRVTKALQAKTPFNAQIRADLGRVLLYRKFYFRTDGFGLVKEENFRTIKNQKLKTGMINYYHESIGQVMDNISEDKDAYQRVLLPYVRQHFTDWIFGEYGMPYNYEDTMNDLYFLTSVTIDAKNCASTIEQLVSAKSVAESLLEQIDIELD